jgi:hypothetical protein
MSGKTSEVQFKKFRKPYSDHEIAQLRRYVVDQRLPWKAISALMPERTLKSLQTTAGVYGFRPVAQRRSASWSAVELEALNARILANPSRPPTPCEVRKLFPDRTLTAVRVRWVRTVSANRLGITMGARSMPWTVEEENLAAASLEKGMNAAQIAAILTGRSAKGVTMKIRQLSSRRLPHLQHHCVC